MLLAALLYSPLLIGSEYLRGYDAYTHIFFSQGYLQQWWTDWDVRWYGGYSRYLYPPLGHQLVAIVMAVIKDRYAAYEIAAWLLIVCWPVAVYLLARNFADSNGALISALIAVIAPPLRSLVFVFGQFAGFAGLVFALFGAAFLGIYVSRGSKVALAASVCFSACCVATHHNTAIFFLSGLLVATSAAQVFVRSSGRQAVARTVLAIALIGAASFAAIVPFWVALPALEMQTPIPHPSRDNFLQNPVAAKFFLTDLYGPLLLFVLFIITSLRRLSFAAVLLFLFFVFYAVCGLGGTTPLPSWIFGSWWAWLTYERFAVWAAVLLIVAAGATMSKVHSAAEALAVLFTGALLVLSTFTWLLAPGQFRSTAAPTDLAFLPNLYDSYPGCADRFLALGFGYQLPEFSLAGSGRTLDGLWHTARSDVLLRLSGVGSLGDALQWSNGEKVLSEFLRRNTPVPANCILLNENSPQAQKYAAIIGPAGWHPASVYPQAVSVWFNGTLPQDLAASQQLSAQPLPQHSVFAILWGTLPLLAFAGALMSAITYGVMAVYEDCRNYRISPELPAT
jgi:hypothetical protein